MNEPKHTPGPWRISGESATTVQVDLRAINSEHGLMIASARGYPNSGYFPNDDEAKANARLIAAAPELLEALKALHHAVCGETGFAEAVRNCSGIAYPWEPLDVADLAARAAIAKAEGAEP